MAKVPKTVSESEPISEITKVTQPVSTKNVAGTQINPATEDTLVARLNITLSALRDAICDPTTPKDLLDIFNQLAATLARNVTQVGGIAQTGADWTPLLQRLDVALSTRATETTATAIRDTQQNVYSQLIGADETVAQSIILDTAGRTLLDIYGTAVAATTFRLDVSNDNTNWVLDYLTWAVAAAGVVKETHTNAFRYLRLKSDAAGAAGDKVTLMLTAAR